MGLSDIIGAALREATKPGRVRAGERFEEYILSLFAASRSWELLRRTQGYHANLQMYETASAGPDFTFRHRRNGRTVDVECKYRTGAGSRGIAWCTDTQYRRYLKDYDPDTYVMIGVGGTASSPAALYLPLLSNLKAPTMPLAALTPYSARPGRCFELYRGRLRQYDGRTSAQLLRAARLDYYKRMLLGS
ncbi:hypothetical protein JXB02_06320 [Candidatus Woesearchaeota archaeon]|nr:hypothetical protein [Candidatus Woesearchaeota archaeon]